MNRDEVIQNLAIVCSEFKGTRAQHEYLQAALQWLKEVLNKVDLENTQSK